jgi:integrase
VSETTIQRILSRRRKPGPATFGAFAHRYLNEYLPGRSLKPTTVENYEYILDRHVLPFFGTRPLAHIEARPELIDSYITAKTQEGLSPKTLQNHLLLLNVMFRRAVVWRLIENNPIASIDRPQARIPEMNILNPDEITRVADAFDELASHASEIERAWWNIGKTIVLTALGTAMRRGELVGLRWSAVDLVEARIEVREAYVRGQFTTPKSKASRRVLELGPRTVATLSDHYRVSLFQEANDLVFCHPSRGTPIEPGTLAKCYLKPALRHAGIGKPFRPFHDLRHTSLTHTAAAGNPQIYVQARAGHSQGSVTERYMHASQLLFPGAAARTEDRMFGISTDRSAQSASQDDTHPRGQPQLPRDPRTPSGQPEANPHRSHHGRQDQSARNDRRTPPRLPGSPSISVAPHHLTESLPMPTARGMNSSENARRLRGEA